MLRAAFGVLALISCIYIHLLMLPDGIWKSKVLQNTTQRALLHAHCCPMHIELVVQHSCATLPRVRAGAAQTVAGRSESTAWLVQVSYYDYALDLILDADSPSTEILTDEQHELVESAAETLYGLIHVRCAVISPT